MADLPNLDAARARLAEWDENMRNQWSWKRAECPELDCYLRDALAAVDVLTAEVARLNALLPCAARSILANRQVELDAARYEGRRERDAEIAAWLSLPCGLADHDDRWCPVCNDRSELADSIKRGAGRKDGAVPWVE